MDDLADRLLFSIGRPVPSRVDVEGFGEPVYVRAMTVAERDSFEAATVARKSTVGFRARLVVACVCREDGSRVFSPADVPKIEAVSSAALDPIVNACLAVNAMRQGDADDIKARSPDGES